MDGRSGWKRLFRLEESHRHLNRNIDEEIMFHLESRIESLMEEGMKEEEARAEAHREFGEIESTREQLARIDNRNLRRRTIGDALSTVLPIRCRNTANGKSEALFTARWEPSPSRPSNYIGGERPERLSGIMVTPEVFQILDTATILGRIFLADDFNGMPQVVILGHSTWRRIFGEDRSIIGKTIILSGHPTVIIGVLDPGWVSPRGLMGEEVDVWLPLDVTLPEFQSTGYYILEVIARLKPGASIKTAQAEMNRLAVTLNEEMPDTFVDWEGNPRRIPIISLQSAITGDIESPLLLLLGAVSLLLAIACANVANLVLARGTEQVHEIGLRFALGASRRRLMGQLLTENALLSVSGGMIGIVIAVFGVWIFNTMNPGGIPMADGRSKSSPSSTRSRMGISQFSELTCADGNSFLEMSCLIRFQL